MVLSLFLDAAALLRIADAADLLRRRFEEAKDVDERERWFEVRSAGVFVVEKWRFGLDAPMVFVITSCR